ncbi:hypothetical protein ZWY2020_020184 [Hordeum vulgare]|nr:hypothetical protein ZWY2020_020184 [Hordeum vulgare]
MRLRREIFGPNESVKTKGLLLSCSLGPAVTLVLPGLARLRRRCFSLFAFPSSPEAQPHRHRHRCSYLVKVTLSPGWGLFRFLENVCCLMISTHLGADELGNLDAKKKGNLS